MEVKKEDIVRLRKTSGQPIMDCKRALQETGSFDEAFEYIRKNATEKIDSRRKDRVANEGRVVIKGSHEFPVYGSKIAMVSLLCETDFTAKSDLFRSRVDRIAELMLALDEEAQKEIKGIIDEVKSQTGEKTELGHTLVYQIPENISVGTYVHFDNKKAAIVQLEAYSNPVELQLLGTNLAMHVVASKPRFCNDEDVEWSEADLTIPENLLNKPKEILDKISRGKRDKFLAETCMLYQPYCLDDSMNVHQAILKVRKEKMMEIKLKKFTHIEIGD
jgi:elongation factor Ts